MTPALSVRGLTKRFGAVLANDRVDVDVAWGEIHALVGGNGAGKSTLVNVLYGVLQRDAGAIHLDGRPVAFRHPVEAIRAGLGLVPQDGRFIENMTALENIILGREPGRYGRIDRRGAAATVEDLMARYGLDCPLDRRADSLTVGERQRIEILKALYRQGRVLLLDEPTGALPPQETARLFAILRSLRDGGAAVVFISHKLREVEAIADRVTVMRTGRTVWTGPRAAVNVEALAEQLVGEALPPLPPRRAPPGDAVILRVDRLCSVAARRPAVAGTVELHDVSFDVRRGEVLGIAGIEGNGQVALEDVLVGLRSPASGTVTLEDRHLTRGSPRAFREAGVAWIPSNRSLHGLVAALSVTENLALGYHHRAPLTVAGILRWPALRSEAARLLREYEVVPPTGAAPAATLSGGNQQRVVIARALAHAPRVVVAAHPSRGIDIRGTRFMHAQIRALQERGVGVVLISSDLDELFALATRIVVLYRGRIVGTVRPENTTLAEMGLLMTGQAAAAA